MGKKSARLLLDIDNRTPPLDRYVSGEEAMQYLGIKSKSTLTKLVNKGAIKAYKISYKFVRYKLSDLDKAMERFQIS